jgi:hypothetical protein
MGGGSGGKYGVSTGHEQLDANISKLSSVFPSNRFGRFGEKGSSTKVRRIASDNPSSTAKEFFQVLSKGGQVQKSASRNVTKVNFKNGFFVIHRQTSKSGGPVVEIRIPNPKGGKAVVQKIHFITESRND